MRYSLVLVLFLCITLLHGQNLVPNASFEEYRECGDTFVVCKSITTESGKVCPSSCCAKMLADYQDHINSGAYNWWAVNLFLPPFYYNKCIINTAFFINNRKGYYKPRSGEAHIMLNTFGYWHSDTTDYRHYAQVKLIEPLQAGCVYEVSCYALLTPNYNPDDNGNNYGSIQRPSDGLSMYLASDSVYMNDPTQQFEAFTAIDPQVNNPSGHLLTDSVNYQKVSGLYQAQGGEQWLVIGNFKDNAHTVVEGDRLTANSMYSIDDVSVTRWQPELVSYEDTSVCIDTSLLVVLPDGLKNIHWSTGDTSQQVSLLGTGTYTVEASNGCEVLRDTFNIHRRIPYTDPFSIGKDSFFCNIPDGFELKAPTSVYFPYYTWSTGSTSKNIAIDTAGTYWLRVDYECGSLSDTVMISEYHPPDTLFLPTKDTTICSDQELELTVWQPEQYGSFLWNDHSTQNHLLASAAGWYILKAKTIAYNCEVTDSVEISMIEPPLPPVFSDTVACEGTIVHLTLSNHGEQGVLWYDGSTLPSHSFSSSGEYWVSTNNQCFESRDSLRIDFLDCSLFIPNLITSNEDGRNDEFKIKTTVERPLKIVIYNSWGNEVYRSDRYQGDWGKETPSGIYFYQVSDSLLNKTYKGWVQVVE